MTTPPTTDAPPATVPAGTGAPNTEAARTFTQEQVNAMMAQEKRLHADYDAIKAKADQLDALTLEMGSATDKAVAAARTEERTAATAAAIPRMVRAEFRAAAKGVLSDDQLAGLLEDYNPANYLTASGDVDEAKIAARVEKFKPATNGTTYQSHARDLGQGNRQPVGSTPGERGLAEAQKRFGKKS